MQIKSRILKTCNATWLWLKLGPVENQVLRDLDATHSEMTQRLEEEETVLASGNVQRFEKRMSRFRNFLAVEVPEAVERIERELEYVETRTSRGPDYHSKLAEHAQEIAELLEQEAERLNNAADQARKRIDRGEDPQQVASELLRLEENEESELQEADRRIEQLAQTVAEHRLSYPYLLARAKRKLTGAAPV